MSSHEIILLAHLIGDGCFAPKQSLHYTSADPKNIDIVASTARWLFGISPRIVPQENWFHVYLPSPYPLTHGRHNPIINWLQGLGLKPARSYEKLLPDKLFMCTEDQICLFLHHLWATDGNISWKRIQKRKPAGAIYYSTTSQKLSKQIQHLLLRVGIMSTLRIVPQGKYKPNYQVHVQGVLAQIRFCQTVGSYGSRGDLVPPLIEALQNIIPNPNTDVIPRHAWKILIEPEKERMGTSWRTFSKQIDTSYCGSTLFKAGLSRDRMTKVAEALKSEMLQALAQSDVYWDEIISVTPLGIEEVFDATVPGTHNFLANDFIVHNSIEQDSDVVLMMYREDYYEEDTDRKGITDIFIRKHRNGPTGHIELMFEREKMRFLDIERQRTLA